MTSICDALRTNPDQMNQFTDQMCNWKQLANVGLSIAWITINALAIQGSMTPMELGLSNIGLMCAMSYIDLSKTRSKYVNATQYQNAVAEEADAQPFSRHGIEFLQEQKNTALKTAAFTLFVFAVLAAINGVGCANLLSAETMGQLTLGIGIGLPCLVALLNCVICAKSARTHGRAALDEMGFEIEAALEGLELPDEKQFVAELPPDQQL